MDSIIQEDLMFKSLEEGTQVDDISSPGLSQNSQSVMKLKEESREKDPWIMEDMFGFQ